MVPKKMKACLLTESNSFEIAELDVPEPGSQEVLCRIRAVAICGTDPEIVYGHHRDKGWPPRYPYVIGHEWAGEVVALGEDVDTFKVGDRVAGEAHKGCGFCKNCLKGNYTICLNYGKPETGHRHYGFTSPGANCEYNVYHVKAVHKIPDSLSFAHASLLDTAGVALHGIEMVGITPGGTVAIYGPGPIGLCAMQIAKGMGAERVVMVGRRHRLKVAAEMGADFAIDFEKVNPVEKIMEITDGQGADEVLECSGGKATIKQSAESAKKGGNVDLIGFYPDDEVILPQMTKLVLDEITICGSRANPNVSEGALNLFKAGVLNGEKVVTHRFPLEEYPEAFDTFVNRKGGAIKVVIEP